MMTGKANSRGFCGLGQAVTYGLVSNANQITDMHGPFYRCARLPAATVVLTGLLAPDVASGQGLQPVKGSGRDGHHRPYGHLVPGEGE